MHSIIEHKNKREANAQTHVCTVHTRFLIKNEFAVKDWIVRAFSFSKGNDHMWFQFKTSSFGIQIKAFCSEQKSDRGRKKEREMMWVNFSIFCYCIEIWDNSEFEKTQKTLIAFRTFNDMAKWNMKQMNEWAAARHFTKLSIYERVTDQQQQIISTDWLNAPA